MDMRNYNPAIDLTGLYKGKAEKTIWLQKCNGCRQFYKSAGGITFCLFEDCLRTKEKVSTDLDRNNYNEEGEHIDS